MIITVSGTAGSGKSTIAKLLAQKLKLKHYSMGDLRGELAQKKGLTIDELNEIGLKEDWTDKEVDEGQRKLGREEDNFVVDGWVSFHFIPHSVKIFLKAEMEEAAKRVFQDQRVDEKKQESVAGVKKMLLKRMKNSRQRYLKYYKIDYLDEKHYDLVVDTTKLNPGEIVKKIIKFIKEKSSE